MVSVIILSDIGKLQSSPTFRNFACFTFYPTRRYANELEVAYFVLSEFITLTHRIIGLFFSAKHGENSSLSTLIDLAFDLI